MLSGQRGIAPGADSTVDERQFCSVCPTGLKTYFLSLNVMGISVKEPKERKSPKLHSSLRAEVPFDLSLFPQHLTPSLSRSTPQEIPVDVKDEKGLCLLKILEAAAHFWNGQGWSGLLEDRDRELTIGDEKPLRARTTRGGPVSWNPKAGNCVPPHFLLPPLRFREGPN